MVHKRVCLLVRRSGAQIEGIHPSQLKRTLGFVPNTSNCGMEPQKERKSRHKLFETPKSLFKKLTGQSRSSSRGLAPTTAGDVDEGGEIPEFPFWDTALNNAGEIALKVAQRYSSGDHAAVLRQKIAE